MPGTEAGSTHAHYGIMAEYTSTYLSVLKRWAAKCGLQYSDLLTTETDLFKEYANDRLRYIWNYADWPETIEVSEEVLTNQEFTADTSIAFIFGVTDYHPFETSSTEVRNYRFRRKQDSVYVYGYAVPSTVYVRYKERAPTFETNTDTIPYRFAEYVAQGAYADWLRAESDPQADSAEARTEQYLQRELEIFERQEAQAQFGRNIQPYKTPVQ